MWYDKYFENEEGLLSLLKDYEDTFNMIDDIGDSLSHGVYDTGDKFREISEQLTGFCMRLEVLRGQAVAAKEIEEDRNYLSIRNKAVDEGQKSPTDNTLKVTAHAAVAQYIKVRNVLESYVRNCEKGVMTCQSSMKNLMKEKFNTQEG